LSGHRLSPLGRSSPDLALDLLCEARVSGDLGLATKGLVEGAIQGAKELGLDATEAASAAASGALRAAGQIGTTAGESVRNALTGTIAGVKVVLKAPFSSGAKSRTRAPSRKDREGERDEFLQARTRRRASGQAPE